MAEVKNNEISQWLSDIKAVLATEEVAQKEPEDDFDPFALCVDVEKIFRKHPPITSLCEYRHPTAAKVCQLFLQALKCNDDVHISSEWADRMEAIINGIAESVLDRLGDEFHWTENELQRLRMNVLGRKRHTRLCPGSLRSDIRCQAQIPMTAWHCDACEAAWQEWQTQQDKDEEKKTDDNK